MNNGLPAMTDHRFGASLPLGGRPGDGDPEERAIFRRIFPAPRIVTPAPARPRAGARAPEGDRSHPQPHHPPPPDARRLLYRPYTQRHITVDIAGADSRSRWRELLPTPTQEREHCVLWLCAGRATPAFALAANQIVAPLPRASNWLCPFFCYDDDGAVRRENISDWALDQFRAHYDEPVISKWSIFDYVYAVLHHPEFREALRLDPARAATHIPLADDFRGLQRAGQRLLELHVNFDRVEPWPLSRVDPPRTRRGTPRDRTPPAVLRVNDSLALGDLPAEAHAYQLGGRSAVEWVMDHARTKSDRRDAASAADERGSGAERRLADLIARVVRVSVETMAITAAMPGLKTSAGPVASTAG